MCEIAILSPKGYSTEQITDVAMDLYRAMRSSLGVVFVKENDEQTKFEYESFESINPEQAHVKAFINTHKDDSIRVIIHGRLATTGAVTEEHQHPLEIDCPECGVDCVIHNGVVYNWELERERLEYDGHEFSTEVDSEVIAHQYGDVPLSFDGEVETGQYTEPAYILMNEDGMYINSRSRYRLSERGEMALSHREFGPGLTTNNYAQVILTPTNAE